jgi:heme-degrading monooxygenase HmoA
MIVVVFEVTVKPGVGQRYFDLAGELRPELEKIDGFLSIERFESLANPGKYVSLSFWRDDEAVARWRAHAGHQIAQALAPRPGPPPAPGLRRSGRRPGSFPAECTLGRDACRRCTAAVSRSPG